MSCKGECLNAPPGHPYRHTDTCVDSPDFKMKPYYTLLVPFVPYKLATEWHPTEDTGPFKVLSRGNFKTVEDAIAWGKEKLDGTPYSVHYVDEDGALHRDLRPTSELYVSYKD